MQKARRTTYNGVVMRSRLEAAFAAYLDRQGHPWVYEPKCFATSTGQYLPDFLVTLDGEPVYVEVKPDIPDAISQAKKQMPIVRKSEPGALLAIAVGTGWPDIRWEIYACERDGTWIHPSQPKTSKPLRPAPVDPKTGRAILGGRARRPEDIERERQIAEWKAQEDKRRALVKQQWLTMLPNTRVTHAKFGRGSVTRRFADGNVDLGLLVDPGAVPVDPEVEIFFHATGALKRFVLGWAPLTLDPAWPAPSGPPIDPLVA